MHSDRGKVRPYFSLPSTFILGAANAIDFGDINTLVRRLLAYSRFTEIFFRRSCGTYFSSIRTEMSSKGSLCWYLFHCDHNVIRYSRHFFICGRKRGQRNFLRALIEELSILEFARFLQFDFTWKIVLSGEIAIIFHSLAFLLTLISSWDFALFSFSEFEKPLLFSGFFFITMQIISKI